MKKLFSYTNTKSGLSTGSKQSFILDLLCNPCSAGHTGLGYKYS